MADRKDWYYKQRVTEAEMDEADTALEAADRAIAKDIMGYGFLVNGTNPATVEERAVPDLNVLVNQLLGYSKLGERVANDRSAYQAASLLGTSAPYTVDLSVDEVSAATTVASPGNEKTITIFVKFHRHESEPRTDGNGDPINWKRDESIQFNVVQSAEATLGNSVPAPARSDELILADITRIYGQTAFLNADIDQSRRENFVLNILHGSSHTETGSDPIPNATPSIGGLHSAADKTKLDTVTWSGAGVAALFNNQFRAYQPANQTVPAAASVDVSGAMGGQTPGGDSSTEGIVTTGADNLVDVRKPNGDSFLNGTGDKVQARLTEAASVWTLSFFYLDETTGAETSYDMTPHSGGGAQFVWFVTRSYALHNLPSSDPSRTIPSDQVAAEVPDATLSVAGKVKIASDGSTSAADTALATNDNRAGRVYGVELAAETGTGPISAGTPTTARRGEIALVQGANVTIDMYDDAGNDRVCFKIAAASGGGGPIFGVLTMQPDGTQSYGTSGYYVGTNHVHPLSGAYATSGHGHSGPSTVSTQQGGTGGAALATIDLTTGKNPVFAIWAWDEIGIANGLGFNQGGGGSLTRESCLQTNSQVFNADRTTSSSVGVYNCTEFSATRVRLTKATGTATYRIFGCAIMEL